MNDIIPCLNDIIPSVNDIIPVMWETIRVIDDISDSIRINTSLLSLHRDFASDLHDNT